VNIVIFGANGKTGRLLTTQALQAGHVVTAVTRRPDDFDATEKNLTVAAADAYDLGQVKAVISGQDVVLSTLGVPYSSKSITIYSGGTENIVEAMKATGVRRLVCVSSSVTDPAFRYEDSGGGFAFEKILKPILTLTMGRTLYADMQRMETLVRASGLDWTIIRPSGLFMTSTVTDYRFAEDRIVGQYTSRRDLADFMLTQATNDAFIGKAVAVATYAEKPSVIQLIKSEAFQSRVKEPPQHTRAVTVAFTDGTK
jgi:putative NADH-flavin reductase